MSRRLMLLAALAVVAPTAASAQDTVEARVASLRQRVSLLKDQDAVENLQAAFGFYFDKGLWGEVADLFAATGSFEYGQRGVYVGKEHIRRSLLLFGAEGPQPGTLNNHMQLQAVIDVAPDGRTAKGRFRGLVMLSRAGGSGQWGEGVYENDYVKEGGVWKIAKLHFYVTTFLDYDRGPQKGPIPLEGPSALYPPDKPPSEVYRAFPGVHVPPFHYPHPVTGKPIDFGGQPADPVLGRPKP
jgi:hypothetical protein